MLLAHAIYLRNIPSTKSEKNLKLGLHPLLAYLKYSSEVLVEISFDPNIYYLVFPVSTRFFFHFCFVSDMDPPSLEPNTMYFGGGKVTERSFLCTAGGANPPPTKYAWFKNDQPVPEESASTNFNEPTVTRATNAIMLKLPDSYKPVPGDKFDCHVGTTEKAMSVSLKIIFGKYSDIIFDNIVQV